MKDVKPVISSAESAWYHIYWNFMHVSAIGCTTKTKQAAYIRMMSSPDCIMQRLIQCNKCSINYAKHLSDYPIEDAHDLYKWSCYIHNTVNKENGKYVLTDADIARMKLVYQSFDWKDVYWSFVHKAAAGCNTPQKIETFKSLMNDNIMSILWYSSEFNSVSLNIMPYMSSNIELLNWSCELHNIINIIMHKDRISGKKLTDIKSSYLKGINTLDITSHSESCNLCDVDVTSVNTVRTSKTTKVTITPLVNRGKSHPKRVISVSE